jgi:[acyl-carrier-protein] S-malonyltransferase
MRAFLFPGQGAQQIGMAADLFRSDAAFRELVSNASQWVGADLERICLRGPDRELVRTEYLQPLLVAVSLGYLGQLTTRGITPQVVLGHSLGEITALAAAGVLTPGAAVRVAAQRGRLMAAAAAGLDGGMLAVITPEPERVWQRLIEGRPGGGVFLANDNAPNQFVCSGSRVGLEEAARRISSEKLGTCRRLAVAGPWHSPLLSEAQQALAHWLPTVPWGAPRVPIIMGASGRRETDPEQIRQDFIRGLTEPVLWRSGLEQLKALQPQALYEVGPGRVLSGLARANGFDDLVRIYNVNDLRGVERAAQL